MIGVANGLIAGLVYWDDDAFAQPRRAADRVLSGWKLPDLPERLGVVLTQNGKRDLETEHCMLLDTWIYEDDRDLSACREAVGASVVGSLRDTQLSKEDAERAADLMLKVEKGGIDTLADLLWEADPPLNALRVAAHLRDNRLLDPVVAAYGNQRRAVRELAVAALGAIEDSRGVGVLLHATRDSEHQVRSNANRALEKLGMSALIFGLAATIKPELTLESLPAGGPAESDELRASPPDRTSPAVSEPPAPRSRRSSGQAGLPRATSCARVRPTRRAGGFRAARPPGAAGRRGHQWRSARRRRGPGATPTAGRRRSSAMHTRMPTHCERALARARRRSWRSSRASPPRSMLRLRRCDTSPAPTWRPRWCWGSCRRPRAR